MTKVELKLTGPSDWLVVAPKLHPGPVHHKYLTHLFTDNHNGTEQSTVGGGEGDVTRTLEHQSNTREPVPLSASSVCSPE